VFRWKALVAPDSGTHSILVEYIFTDEPTETISHPERLAKARWTASHAVAASLGNSYVTSTSEAFPPPLMVQYSDRGRNSGDRDYRDRYRPNDDRAGGFEDRNGDGGDRHHGRGASFFLRVGDTRIAARCSNVETMRACVDATLMLLDKAKSLQGIPTEPSSPAR
jgi:hypothetical protein